VSSTLIPGLPQHHYRHRDVRHCPPDVRDIHMREVSTLVNNVRNNGTELLEPIDPQAEQARLL